MKSLSIPGLKYVSLWSLHCALASCGAVYCNRSCLWVCGGWAGGRADRPAGGRCPNLTTASARVSLSVFSNMLPATTADDFVHRHHRLYWFHEHDSLQLVTVPFRWPEAVSETICRTSSHQLRLSLFSGIYLTPTCSLIRSRIDCRLYTV